MNNKAKFRKVYAEKTNDALFRLLAEGGLTKVALEALCDEFTERGTSVYDVFCALGLHEYQRARQRLHSEISGLRQEADVLRQEIAALKASKEKIRKEKPKIPGLIGLTLERKKLEKEERIRSLKQKK